MVNFADAVTKISYGKLMTTTPNAKGVEKFLHNVAITNKLPYGGLPNLFAKDAMYQMGAKGKTRAKGLYNEFQDKFGHFEPHGLMDQEIFAKTPIISIKHNPGALKEFHEKMSGELGLLSAMILSLPFPKPGEYAKIIKDYLSRHNNIK